jgi:hypothetical protein
MVFKSLMCAIYMLILTAFNVSAYVYTYTGNNYSIFTAPYTTDMEVVLQFETALPLVATGAMTNVSAEVLSFTMFDGRITLTETDSLIDLLVNIDTTTGLPTEWAINTTNEFGKSIGDIVNRMGTVYNSYSGGIDAVEELECTVISPISGDCSGFNFIAGADVLNEPGSPGTWSVVPIPAAFWLLGSGLIGLIGVAQRKRNSKYRRS